MEESVILGGSGEARKDTESSAPSSGYDMLQLGDEKSGTAGCSCVP